MKRLDTNESLISAAEADGGALGAYRGTESSQDQQTGDQLRAKLLMDKRVCDKTKAVVKKLLSQIDGSKSGAVKTPVFVKICELHNIRLSKKGF